MKRVGLHIPVILSDAALEYAFMKEPCACQHMHTPCNIYLFAYSAIFTPQNHASHITLHENKAHFSPLPVGCKPSSSCSCCRSLPFWWLRDRYFSLHLLLKRSLSEWSALMDLSELEVFSSQRVRSMETRLSSDRRGKVVEALWNWEQRIWTARQSSRRTSVPSKINGMVSYGSHLLMGSVGSGDETKALKEILSSHVAARNPTSADVTVGDALTWAQLTLQHREGWHREGPGDVGWGNVGQGGAMWGGAKNTDLWHHGVFNHGRSNEEKNNWQSCGWKPLTALNWGWTWNPNLDVKNYFEKLGHVWESSSGKRHNLIKFYSQLKNIPLIW